MDEAQINNFILDLPKADLHVHFEGTVTAELLESLASRHQVAADAPVSFNGTGPIPLPPLRSDGRWAFSSFNDFIAVYKRITECIRDADDVVAVGLEYLAEAKRQNIQYSEIYLSPSSFASCGADLREIFSGLLYIECCAPEYGTEVSWVFDVVRNTPQLAASVLEHASHARNVGLSVHAIGLAGSEAGYPASQFKRLFDQARKEGFTILSHAGETAGADSIWDALDALNPKRIGHGVRVLEDPELVDELAQQGRPFEVCPCSNISLGLFSSESHPLPEMLDADLNCVICSDDPGIFRKDLCENYLFAAQRGVSTDTLEELADSSLSPALRSRFGGDGHDVFRQLRQERAAGRTRAMASSRLP